MNLMFIGTSEGTLRRFEDEWQRAPVNFQQKKQLRVIHKCLIKMTKIERKMLTSKWQGSIQHSMRQNAMNQHMDIALEAQSKFNAYA